MQRSVRAYYSLGFIDVVTANESSSSFESRDPDDDLVQLCLRGNTAVSKASQHQSFQQLYQRHQQRVRSILYQLCGATLLDDLVQEVFMRAWKGLPKFQRSAKFSTWLYRIAWNVASDQRQGFAQGRSRLQALAHTTPQQYEGPNLLHLHYQDLVQRGLAQLSLAHRSVLVLHDLEEVPQKEVSEILEVPVGTVKSRLFHARAALRQFLQQEGVQL